MFKMITSLRLRNFRCFQDHQLMLKPTTVIVGGNNAGKSTVIEALRLISLVVNRYGAANFQDVPQWLEIPRIQRGIAPSTRGLEWNTLSMNYMLGEPPAQISATFENGMAIELYIGPRGELHAVIMDSAGKPIITKGQTHHSHLSNVSILPQIGPVAREEKILEPEYARRVIPASWASIHFRNQINYFPQHFDEFAFLAESTWQDLRILPLEGQGGLPGEQLALLLRDHDFVSEVGWMGHGLQMWLQTMWFLARSPHSETIILDEPDVYMHADLQRKLIRLLKGRHPQTIVATHSVEIMADVDASDILIINRQNNTSLFATSIPAVQRVIEGLGGIHNLQLARLTGAGRCLLVEGEDIPYLKEIQNKISPRTIEALDVIPNMPIGGWGGWNYAVGSQMLLRNGMGQDITVYCLLDSDFHTPEEIESRLKDAAQKGVQLHVWTKKEIENFFIVPSVIHRIIEQQRRTVTEIPSIPRIVEVIDEIAESLKEIVFDAMSHEYHIADRAGGVANANKRARERLDEIWKTFEGRVSIISGKRAISELSKWTQSEFQVSLSPMKLAQAMQRDEIELELVNIVRSIERGRLFP